MTDPSPTPSPRPEQGLLCPECRVDLVMTDRQGVEIDYCPKCRGVWLDRGELDKIIERSAAFETGAPQPQPIAPSLPMPAPDYGQPWNGGYAGGRGGHGGKRGGGQGGGHGGGGNGGRRRGFLGSLFDD